MDKLELPIEIKSLDEYKQCVFKISDWFDDNHMRLMDLDSGYESYKKIRDLNDAKFYFFLIALEISEKARMPKDKRLNDIYKMILTSISDSLCHRLAELDKQLETLDNSCDKK